MEETPQMLKEKERMQLSLDRLILGKIAIFEAEVTLLPLTPRPLPVKVNINTLFVLIRNRLRLRVTLEPSEVFHMEAPGLTLEFLCSKVSKAQYHQSETREQYVWAGSLLVRARKVVEHPEKSFNIQL